MRVITSLLLALLILAPSAAAKPLRTPDLIVVHKAERLMTLYADRKAIKTYRIALGGNPLGHKEQQGDSRTPEGRYTIDAKNPQSSFHLSLHISYPNANDRRSARRRRVDPGGAIMIHGTPESLTAVRTLGVFNDWTAGCIAVTNEEIEEIFHAVRIGTPILIKP